MIEIKYYKSLHSIRLAFTKSCFLKAVDKFVVE